jgi:threonine dehydrogenase-like Zn-dependent dehydrogenase
MHSVSGGPDWELQGITFVTGRPHVRTLMPEVLDLIREGKFDPTPMTVQTVA